jgi:tRNA pseudouridine32 synthase/23S rRNA pseudouridine746 synthase
LNTPIVGDELYGTQGARLMLHADRVVFLHPVSGEEMVVESNSEF